MATCLSHLFHCFQCTMLSSPNNNDNPKWNQNKIFFKDIAIKMRDIAAVEFGAKMSQASSHHSQFSPRNILDR